MPKNSHFPLHMLCQAEDRWIPFSKTGRVAEQSAHLGCNWDMRSPAVILPSCRTISSNLAAVVFRDRSLPHQHRPTTSPRRDRGITMDRAEAGHPGAGVRNGQWPDGPRHTHLQRIRRLQRVASSPIASMPGRTRSRRSVRKWRRDRAVTFAENQARRTR